MTILVHEKTQHSLTAFRDAPPHAVLFAGLKGIGLHALAEEIAQQWGTVLTTIEPTAKSKTSLATIDAKTIRELYEQTRMKAESRYVAIIDDADTMTDTAQNALLKLLEEPAKNMHFILTSHRPDNLLATIRSRVQTVLVHPIDSAASARLLRSLGVTDDAVKQQLLYVADGLPAELTRLAGNKSYLEATIGNVRQARDFLSGNTYTRMVTIQAVATSRQTALDFIDTTVLMLKKVIETNYDVQNVQLLDALLDAKEAIGRNANVKLQLASVVL